MLHFVVALVCLAYACTDYAPIHFQLLKDAATPVWPQLEHAQLRDVLFWGAVFLSLTLLLIHALRFLFSPLERVQNLEDVGFLRHDKRSSLTIAQDMRKRRDRGNLPPPFPNGWYCLANSREIKEKGVKNVEALGHHFAVFRGEDGQAYVLDAYCPHLGANLACGGKVTGNSLQCPFHGWEFRGEDGKCVNIPYTNSIPANAKTKSWPTMEINGQILVWFDAEDREPSWAPPSLPEIQSGKWSRRGYTQHTILAHIQEIPENGADVPHLNFLHGPIVLAGTDLREIQTGKGPSIPWIQHTWEASWSPGKEESGSHTALLTLRHGISLFGRDLPFLAIDVRANQIGPSLVYLTFESAMGKGAFVQSLLPVGPLEQLITHEVWAEWRFPTVIAKFFLMGEAMQVERDLMVWNNKKFAHKPLLTKDEGLILQFRRWYSQFYSDSSREVAEKSVNSLDW